MSLNNIFCLLFSPFIFNFVFILLQVCNTSSPIDFEVNVSGPCIPRCEVEHMNYSNSASILIPNYDDGDYDFVISLTAPTMQQCYIDSIKLGEELPYTLMRTKSLLFDCGDCPPISYYTNSPGCTVPLNNGAFWLTTKLKFPSWLLPAHCISTLFCIWLWYMTIITAFLRNIVHLTLVCWYNFSELSGIYQHTWPILAIVSVRNRATIVNIE